MKSRQAAKHHSWKTLHGMYHSTELIDLILERVRLLDVLSNRFIRLLLVDSGSSLAERLPESQNGLCPIKLCMQFWLSDMNQILCEVLII